MQPKTIELIFIRSQGYVLQRPEEGLLGPQPCG